MWSDECQPTSYFQAKTVFRQSLSYNRTHQKLSVFNHFEETGTPLGVHAHDILPALEHCFHHVHMTQATYSVQCSRIVENHCHGSLNSVDMFASNKMLIYTKILHKCSSKTIVASAGIYFIEPTICMRNYKSTLCGLISTLNSRWWLVRLTPGWQQSCRRECKERELSTQHMHTSLGGDSYTVYHFQHTCLMTFTIQNIHRW